MRTTSNPILRTLPGKEGGGYAQFGAGAAGAGAMAAQQMRQDPYTAYPEAQAGVSRPLTIDDVVTKTGITLGVIVAVAIASFFLVSTNPALAVPFLVVGGLGGLIMVAIASFGRKQDNPAIVLSYAAFEGLFVGAISFALTFQVAGANAGALIGQAVLGTVGVFIGMLFVYRSGAIRVTPSSSGCYWPRWSACWCWPWATWCSDSSASTWGCAAVARSQSSSRWSASALPRSAS